MSPWSRRTQSIEKRAKNQIVKFLFLTTTLVSFLIFVGPKLVIKFSLVSEKFKNKKDTSLGSIHPILLAPKLHPSTEFTKEKNISLSGTGQPETTVELYVNNVSKTKTEVKTDGTFEIKNLQLSIGENRITAVTKSISGEESSPSDPLVLTYKSTPPSLHLEQPEDGEHAVSNTSQATIVGTTDPENKVTVNDRVIIVNRDGSFKYTVNLQSGNNEFSIKALDPAGNEIVQKKIITYNP